jgi:predicted DNA-binding protein (MmcQ/YjbR family)
MLPETVREHCLALKGVTESFPFDDDTLVFKVAGKIFALVSLAENRVNLKCDPEKAIALREEYPDVLPGYHMNKRYWNTVLLNGSVPEKLIREWIMESYRLVVGGLPLKQRKELGYDDGKS